jgi:tetrapyrrole methylase family protein/MazG family protein
MTTEPNDDSAGLARLVEVCRRLMAEDGCPWDRDQTLETITPYLQEETFEIVEAIHARDGALLREEIGDLFYLLVFAAALGRKEGLGTELGGILAGSAEKLVRRHPHVFGETRVDGADGAIQQWEEIKKAENGAGTTLGKRPPGLPALTTAFRIQEKAAAVRFEWTDVRGALAKLREEIDELEETLDQSGPEGAARRRDEVGDILYSVVNLSRYLRVDPEAALRGTIAKFMNRFLFIEQELAGRGRTPATSSLEEMDALWNEAKRRGIR